MNGGKSISATCLAPPPEPSAPTCPLPKSAKDRHSNLVLPEANYPFVANRSYTPPPATLAQYKALHRRLEIERAVILQPSVYETNNTVTLEAIAGYDPECRGSEVEDADAPLAELKRLHAGGI